MRGWFDLVFVAFSSDPVRISLSLDHVGAGDSARFEQQQSLLAAEELERMAAAERERARAYSTGARGEESVGRSLSALVNLGWTVLADRQWGRSANIDFLVVGPGGVLIADAKLWRSLEIRNGSIYRDDECCDVEAEKLRALRVRIAELLLDAEDELSLTYQAIWPVLVFVGQRLRTEAQGVHVVGEATVASWATGLGRRLDPDAIARIATKLDAAFPPKQLTKRSSRRFLRPRPPVPIAAESLFDVDELAADLVAAAMAGPIESWMTFLHPEQNRLVRSSWNGPARIRGAAGTGKTVVALHRAVYLAEQGRQHVVFATFVRTLPRVLQGLCVRLAPHVADRIEFTGIHQLAGRILDEHGVPRRLDPSRTDEVWRDAWGRVGEAGLLGRRSVQPGYWREELDYVIKGRGLTDFSEYAALPRRGRRTGMPAGDREAMWDLYTEYERLRRDAGVHDFNDILLMARDVVVEDGMSLGVDAVVLDEVQDINLIGLELASGLAGEGPDRLLLVGDGQQAIYPGGYTLAEAGISISGRASILRSNYRNTRQILREALRLVGDDDFDDLEGQSERGAREVDASRDGPRPLKMHFDSRASMDTGLVGVLRGTLGAGRASWGDMAVLAHTRKEVERLRRVLDRSDIPFVDLEAYAGRSTEAVKLGTFKRAKGLEFKYVFLPGLTDGRPRMWRDESPESYAERERLLRRELFVGMTRARDGLWLGYLAE